MKKIFLLFFLIVSYQLHAQLTGTKVVGAGGDYPTLAAAVAALNAQGPGAGGVIFNIKGGHTETVANGIPFPVSTAAGLLITRGGTAANPVTIKWDGTGTKPTFTSGVGISNYDFVIGIAGQDYITIDGLKIVDAPTHSNNNQRAEIGIGLFKEQYNVTQGNNGCNHVTIKNCEITLTRYPNTTLKTTYVQYPAFSSGIFLSHFTSKRSGSLSSAYFSYSNPNQGIKTDQDVHRDNIIVGNKIDNCSNGIRIQDAWLQSGTTVIAGTGNVIGRSGEANIITNFGPLSTVSYDMITRNANNAYAVNYGNMSAIDVGGQKDFTIEFNNISGAGGGGEYGPRFINGINAGVSGGGAFSLPRSSLSNFKINNNTISGINATNNYDPRHTIAINFTSNSDPKEVAKGGGNIEIKNNTISNLYANRGNVIGVGCNLVQELINTYFPFHGISYQSTGNVSITGNTISSLSRASNINASVLSGIYWRHGSKNLYVNNNSISNFTYGTAGTTPVLNMAGLFGIFISSEQSVVTRELVEAKNNVIDNLDILAATGSLQPVGSTMLAVHYAGVSNVIENNQIKNCDLFNCANTNTSVPTMLIWSYGAPKSGASTISITGNELTNNNRTGVYSGANIGKYAPFAAITTDFPLSNQTRTISNNIISGLTQTANPAHSPESYALMIGIWTRGKTTFGNSTTISGNTIKGISGVSSTYRQQIAYNTGLLTYRLPMMAIAAEEFNQLTISSNNITNMESTSPGYAADVNTAYGPTAIGVYNTTEARNTTANIVNNFISDLRAPSMRGLLAINGIVLSGRSFKYNVYQNTIALGSTAGGTTGRLTSATTGAFGVTGLLLANFILNDKRYLTDIRNNIISINATAKGVGCAMGIRSMTLTPVKKVPLGIDKASNGNAYFINSDLRNYIHGQGTVYGTIGGIRNAYAFSGATVSTTYNLVNDGINFNTTCGLYKTFMAGAEKESAVDISGSAITSLPFVGSGTVPDNLKITNSTTSAVFNAQRITSPLLVDKDYFQTTRGATKVTAGAHESSGTYTVSEIAFDFNGIEDDVCQGNKSLAVTITAPTGKTIQASGSNAPRLYYRRVMNANAITAAQSDNNVMPSAADNNAAGIEGWRWVQATSNSGNVFNFVMDMALLKSTIVTTPSYTIEYFVGAQTTDGTKAGFSSGDWSLNVASGSSTCPGSVALETYSVPPVPADPLATTLDDNSVADNFTIYRGADLTKTVELAQASVCAGGSAGVTAHYSVTSTASQIGNNYRFQVANDNAFTSGLQEFDQADSVLNYVTTSNTTKYIRSWLLCGSSLVANSNSNIVTLTVSNVPVNTSTLTDRNSCENAAQSFSLTSTADPTNQSRFYWLVSPKLKVFNNAPTANTTASSTLSVTPGSKDHSGTWNSYVTTSVAGTLATAGFPSASLNGSETGKFESGAGLAFTANQFIKLNSVKVKDVVDDQGAASTDDFYVRLYSKDGYLLYSQTVTTDIANGALLTIALTNWYIAPGDYNLVIEAVAAAPETGYTSSLVFTGADFPIANPASGSTSFSITGGVSNLTIDGDTGEASFSLTADYNYFFDLNVSSYCTSNAKPFVWTINPASCCSATAPAVGTITNATTSPELSSNDCKLVNGWYYYFDPATPSKLLFAIHPNGNTFDPSSIIVDNSGAVADASHKVTTNGYNAELMPYMSQFTTGDELTVNGGIKVRVFYPAAQKTAVDAGTYDVSSWFSYPGSKTEVLSNLSGTGVESAVLLTPSATGTENSIPYVEFQNITTSSAFGYVRFDRALKVKAKLLLQGAMPATGTIMRNDLQNYLNDNGVALLPTMNPYGIDGTFYNQINNPDGPAGKVVDWIVLELRSSADPSTVLAKGAFLLRPDGTVVDTLGNAELSFKTAVEQVPMHLVAHHRNHLAVMSSIISTFPSDILEHDFTTGLAKAFNAGGDPDQLVQTNGVWTMIAGDVNQVQNQVIDVADKTIVQLDFNSGLFDEYLKSDLTMDGVVDIRDLALANANFLQGYYSSLANY